MKQDLHKPLAHRCVAFLTETKMSKQPKCHRGMSTFRLKCGAWRDGSAVENTFCSSEGGGGFPAPMLSCSQPPVTPALECPIQVHSSTHIKKKHCRDWGVWEALATGVRPKFPSSHHIREDGLMAHLESQLWDRQIPKTLRPTSLACVFYELQTPGGPCLKNQGRCLLRNPHRRLNSGLHTHAPT